MCFTESVLAVNLRALRHDCSLVKFLLPVLYTNGSKALAGEPAGLCKQPHRCPSRSGRSWYDFEFDWRQEDRAEATRLLRRSRYLGLDRDQRGRRGIHHRRK